MQFEQDLLEGRLIRRYKRFLADVELGQGRVVTAHTANTGAMTGCATPGSRVWLSDSGNAQRKYPLTWEIVEVMDGHAGPTLVGINTQLPNRLLEEAIMQGLIPELAGYHWCRREVCYGKENSRIDLLLGGHARLPDCYVEVKNVTLAEGGIALFPDAVSTRGSRHLRELMQMAAAGFRAVLLFCVQRDDVTEVRPADSIDPVYGATLRQALAHGVELYAWRARVTPQAITLECALPVLCP